MIRHYVWTWINHLGHLWQKKQHQYILMGHQCHQRTVIYYILSQFFSYFSIYFWLFSHILSHFIGLCIWNCLFRKSTPPHLSTSIGTLYFSNIWLGSIISKDWGRRNSSISGFDWPSVPSQNMCFQPLSFFRKNLSFYIFLWFFGYFIGFYWFMCLELPV